MNELITISVNISFSVFQYNNIRKLRRSVFGQEACLCKTITQPLSRSDCGPVCTLRSPFPWQPSDGADSHYFDIDRETGEISIAENIPDSELLQPITLVVKVTRSRLPRCHGDGGHKNIRPAFVTWVQETIVVSVAKA